MTPVPPATIQAMAKAMTMKTMAMTRTMVCRATRPWAAWTTS